MKPFRNINNTRKTQALFYETTGEDKAGVVYTLKDIDHEGFPSLYRLYLEEGDLTEYLFANKYLDSWDHWQMLAEKEWFKPYVLRWRKELELKLKAESLNLIRQTATGGGKNAFVAAKYLLENSWNGDRTGRFTKGRPSKDEIHKAAKEEAQRMELILDDFSRLEEHRSGVN